jgi:hypothetical protein
VFVWLLAWVNLCTRLRIRCVPPWRPFSKVCGLGVRFRRIRVEARHIRKKCLQIQTHPDTCGRGLNQSRSLSMPVPRLKAHTDQTRFGNLTRIFSSQKQIKPSTRYADQMAKIAKWSRIFEKQ